MSQTIGTTKGTTSKTYIKTPWKLHQFLPRSAHQTKKSCGNNVTREAQTNHNFLMQIDRKSMAY